MATSKGTLFILSASSGYGGAERSIELLATHLQNDYTLTIFAESPLHLNALSNIVRSPSRVKRLDVGLGRWQLAAAAVQLTEAILHRNPRTIIANTYRSALALASVGRILPWIGKRSFLYVRDFMWTNLDYILSGLPGVRVLVPSPAVLGRYGYLCERINSECCFILPDMVKLPEATAGSDERYLLHLATVNPWKGHDHLLRALALLRQRGRQVRVRSLGVTEDPRLRDALEWHIRNLKISDLISLEPFMENIEPLWEGCIASVVTSVSHSGGPETFGRTIIEGWAHGKAAIAFAAGGPTHLIQHEQNGLLVPEGDEHALAETLWRITADRALRKRLGLKGRETVEQHYQLAKVGQRLSGIISAKQ